MNTIPTLVAGNPEKFSQTIISTVKKKKENKKQIQRKTKSIV